MSSLGHKLGDKQIAGLDHKLGYSYACQLDSCALRPVFFLCRQLCWTPVNCVQIRCLRIETSTIWLCNDWRVQVFCSSLKYFLERTLRPKLLKMLRQAVASASPFFSRRLSRWSANFTHTIHRSLRRHWQSLRILHRFFFYTSTCFGDEFECRVASCMATKLFLKYIVCTIWILWVFAILHLESWLKQTHWVQLHF
jgi:hypothetical protein